MTDFMPHKALPKAAPTSRFSQAIDSRVASRIREKWATYLEPGKQKRSVIATQVAARDIADLLQEIVKYEAVLENAQDPEIEAIVSSDPIVETIDESVAVPRGNTFEDRPIVSC